MLIPDSYAQLFKKFSREENEYLISFFQGEGWTCHPFGYLFGKLTEKNQDIVCLIGDIKQKISDDGFKNFVINLEKSKNIKEAESLIERIRKYKECDQVDYISINKLESISAYIRDIDFKKFINYYKSIYNSLLEPVNPFNFEVDDYVSLKIIELLYEYCMHSLNRFSVPENNNLESMYSKNGIFLKEVDDQYNKYQLLTIGNDFEISDSNITKVYDNRIGSYIFIKEIPLELLKVFKQLRKDGLIGSISLRPEYTICGEGFIDLSFAFEELERGELFSLDRLGFPLITKLYSNQYNNLWIIIDRKNITFEEIIQDFYIYNDFIVTQVVHLEYKDDEVAGPVITHIDHEYIFYTVEEYDLRQQDYTQKGNAMKRYKTFKIDNSKIPFCVDENFILYFILEKFFREKDLLVEYFENVLKL